MASATPSQIGYKFIILSANQWRSLLARDRYVRQCTGDDGGIRGIYPADVATVLNLIPCVIGIAAYHVYQRSPAKRRVCWEGHIRTRS